MCGGGLREGGRRGNVRMATLLLSFKRSKMAGSEHFLKNVFGRLMSALLFLKVHHIFFGTLPKKCRRDMVG